MAYKAVENRPSILTSFKSIQDKGGATHIDGNKAFSGDSVVNAFIDVERNTWQARAEASIRIYTDRYGKSSLPVTVNIHTTDGTLELLSISQISNEEQENLEREYAALLRKYGILALPETAIFKEDVSSLVLQESKEKLPLIKTLGGGNFYIKVGGDIEEKTYEARGTPGHISNPPQRVQHWARGGIGTWWIDYLYIDSSDNVHRVQDSGRQWPFRDIHLATLDYTIE
jgi:hypothetical protein